MVWAVSVEEKVLKRAEEIARKASAMASPIRVLVLAVIALRGEARWHEIKGALEELVGSINPNTLAFHINRLVEAGYVERAGPQRSPRYFARNVPPEVEGLLEDLSKALREVREGG